MAKSEPSPGQIQAGEAYEKLVGDIYEADGWQVNRHGWRKQARDQGVDLICNKGNRRVLIQCKCWAFDRGLLVEIEKFAANAEAWRKCRGEVHNQTVMFEADSFRYLHVFVVTIAASDEARAHAERHGVLLKDAQTTTTLDKCLRRLQYVEVRYSRRRDADESLPDWNVTPVSRPKGCLGMVALVTITFGVLFLFQFLA